MWRKNIYVALEIKIKRNTYWIIRAQFGAAFRSFEELSTINRWCAPAPPLVWLWPFETARCAKERHKFHLSRACTVGQCLTHKWTDYWFPGLTDLTDIDKPTVQIFRRLTKVRAEIHWALNEFWCFFFDGMKLQNICGLKVIFVPWSKHIKRSFLNYIKQFGAPFFINMEKKISWVILKGSGFDWWH